MVRVSNWLINRLLKIRTPISREISLFPISGLKSVIIGNSKAWRVRNFFKSGFFEVRFFESGFFESGTAAGKVGIGTWASAKAF